MRAGIQTRCDGHTLTARQTPGSAWGLVNFDVGPSQQGVVRYGIKGETQRFNFHTRQRANLQSQVRDALERVALAGLFQHAQDATGQTEFMHGEFPEG
jgi:hypothetical protein